MRKTLPFLVLLAGCSTAPVADVLDLVFPAKAATGGPGRGGVCNPVPANVGGSGGLLPPAAGETPPPPAPPPGNAP